MKPHRAARERRRVLLREASILFRNLGLSTPSHFVLKAYVRRLGPAAPPLPMPRLYDCFPGALSVVEPAPKAGPLADRLFIAALLVDADRGARSLAYDYRGRSPIRVLIAVLATVLAEGLILPVRRAIGWMT